MLSHNLLNLLVEWGPLPPRCGSLCATGFNLEPPSGGFVAGSICCLNDYDLLSNIGWGDQRKTAFRTLCAGGLLRLVTLGAEPGWTAGRHQFVDPLQLSADFWCCADSVSSPATSSAVWHEGTLGFKG